MIETAEKPQVSAELITRLYATVDRCSWPELDSIFHPNIEYERPGYDVVVGLDALQHFYQHTRVIASGTHHVEQVVVDGDHGACWGRFVGTRRDGVAVDERWADAFSFEDGRIRTRRSFFYRAAV